jgi:hypothetical protein
MKTRYRLICRSSRGGKFYCVDTTTGHRTSLRTTNQDEARQLVEAKNIAHRQPTLNLQLARAYRPCAHIQSSMLHIERVSGDATSGRLVHSPDVVNPTTWTNWKTVLNSEISQKVGSRWDFIVSLVIY